MLKVAIILASLYLALALFLYFNQYKLIYFPSNVLPSPGEAGVSEMRVVTFQTSDGLSLKAWYKPAEQAGLPTLVYLHGNAGHLGFRAPLIKPFLDEGYGVLLVAYRGYSGNPGKPHEEGLYHDARSALKFLTDKGIPLSCIVLYGESIGTAVALQIASEVHIGAAILQSPFLSLRDVAQFHYSFFPTQWLLRDTFDSIKKIESIHSPILVLYSQNDEVIPPALSIQLFEALNPPKQLQPVVNLGHNDRFDPRFAIEFIRKYVRC